VFAYRFPFLRYLLLQIIFWLVSYLFLGFISHLLLMLAGTGQIKGSLAENLILSTLFGFFYGVAAGFVGWFFERRFFYNKALWVVFLGKIVISLIVFVILINIVRFVFHPYVSKLLFSTAVFITEKKSWDAFFYLMLIYNIAIELLITFINQVNKKLSNYEQKLAEKDQKLLILETATEFPDFKEVVTAENIEKYIKSDEDNREAVEKASNPLRKVYNLIKKDARYQADKASLATKDKPISQEQRRVDEKEGKPKTGSLGVRSEAVTMAAQISNSRMTKEQKAALWKETLAAARK